MYFHSKTKLKTKSNRSTETIVLTSFPCIPYQGISKRRVVGPLIFRHVKVRLKRFHLNGNIIEVYPQTQKLELHTK